ncbi:ISXO2-like transposase domain protein [compost metagenome]
MTHSIYSEDMEGTVEMDETFVGGKNKNRHKDKKVKQSQGRSFKDKTPVFGMLQRSSPSRVICRVVPDTKAKSIQPIITEKVKKNTTVMTDEWQAYNGLEARYNRFFVDHGRGQYADEGGVTTNRIENFWSCFKRTLNGAYNNRVSSKHLQRYADESSFRFNTRENKQDQTMSLFLETATTRKLTYKQLVHGNG